MKIIFALAVIGICLVGSRSGLEARPAVDLGIDVLASNGFKGLEGKRLGVITNQTGVTGAGQSTIDLLKSAPGLNLVALYAPEHGLYGAEVAGNDVSSTKDLRTGLPVYSLYGDTRKPTQEMLAGIDVLIFDIQDIGCRSYTYISTMGLAMEAAGEAKKEFYVLDRPNPLGGTRVEGMPLDPQYRSFVSQWSVPYVHGLTVGELAYMIHGERWITTRPRLTVVPMRGWSRSMSWSETGLLWVPTSPHIPTPETAMSYVVTGLLGEFGPINNGVGTTLPFALLGAPELDRFGFAQAMNKRDLPGLYFRPMAYRPFYGSLKDKLVNGLQIHYQNPGVVNLTNTAMLLIEELRSRLGNEMFGKMTPSQVNMFAKLCGGTTVLDHFKAGKPASELIQTWESSLAEFREKRAQYLLYK